MTNTLRRLVLCNPHARAGGRVSAVAYVSRLLRARGLSAEIVDTGSWLETREAARRAAEDGYAQVVAAGGDGTVNAVANGLAGGEAALGILPLGTGNVLAHNLGLSRLPDALEALAGGRHRRLDLGMLGDRGFVAIAGVGFDAEITQNLDANWKQHVGRVAFVGQSLITRFQNLPHIFRIHLWGEEETVIEEPMWSAVILNVPEFTWKLPLARQAACDDGWLHLALFRDSNAWAFLYGVTQLLSRQGDVGDLPGVSLHRVRAARIETDPPWLWEVDGDTVGATPVEVTVQPGALRVLAGGE
jgi:YegS/Rv2252/BmrU family lipid kinase